MKNKLTIILGAAVVILAIAGYFIGAEYQRALRANDALDARIGAAAQSLADIPRPEAGLEEQLDAAGDELEAARASLPQPVGSTRIIDTILELAESCQVKAIPLTTDPWARESLGQEYDVLRLSLSVSGGFTRVSRFISLLEKETFEVIVIESLEVKRDASAEATPGAVNGSLSLAIYTRPAETG